MPNAAAASPIVVTGACCARLYIADTDAEARKLALNGMMGRAYREYLLPLFGSFRLWPVFKHDQSVADSDVTPEYLVDHHWLVGSSSTVAGKLGGMVQESGGFNTLLVINFDFKDEYSAWTASRTALMQEVLPQFNRAAAAPSAPAAAAFERCAAIQAR